MTKPLGLHAAWASCVSCLLLSAPLAHAGTFSVLVSAGPTVFGCSTGSDEAGGSGFSSAVVGPSSCAFTPPAGGSISSTASASGSWLTGDLSVAAVGAANPNMFGGSNSISSFATATLTVEGRVTLPSGMDSGPITLGVTGLSGLVNAGPAAPLGGATSGDIVTLSMSAGGSGGTSGMSAACLMLNLFSDLCPNGGFGFGFGPGALAPVTLLVHDGDTVQLTVFLEAVATADAVAGPEGAAASGSIDPIYLTLPDGATFDSGIDGFLSVVPTPAVPEPATFVLFAMGVGALAAVRRRRHAEPTGDIR